jgi:hypothetical protein
MKNLLAVLTLALFTQVSTASLVHLEFSNGWTVDFDDTVTDLFDFTVGYDSYSYDNDSFVLTNPDNPLITSNDHPSYVNYTDASTPGDSSMITFFDGYEDSNAELINYNSITLNLESSTGTILDFLQENLNNAPHFNAIRNDGPINVINNVTLTSITTSPVPVPGAVWLMGTALLGLVTKRKLV